MGKRKGPYKIEYSLGSLVRIANLERLEEFSRTWKYHHPLQAEQLQYHGRIGKVKSGAFYHGGDELYEVEGVPGIWHEQCLSAVVDPKKQ
jgi:hypothetical protein